jgi:hypothetical protein
MNAIGFDKISDFVMSIATKIGKDKQTREGYINKK